MKFKGLSLIWPSMLIMSGCDKNLPLDTVEYVDVQKYTGTWYEIASFPNWFQKDCTGTTATYSLNKDGSIRVFNKCFKKSLTGEEDTAEGIAYIDDTITNAKLKVSFFFPFKGDYWIIELADDYSYAVVGHPNRKYLWILSRTPEMSDTTYQSLLTSISKKGFDISKLTKTIQFSHLK
jgi:apolipoprotein D and lipocalin family protein